MKFPALACPAFLVLAAAVASCATLPPIRAPEGGDDNFLVWAFSDVQPRNEAERRQFELAAEDAGRQFPYLDMAIVAGDIVQGGAGKNPEDEYDWFLSARAKARVGSWFEIAGNHDARDLAAYLEKTDKPAHYALFMGNILVLMLSDETASSGTDIPDGVFEWWKRMVAANQDKIIVTVTHSHLAGSGFPYAILGYRNVRDSSRFEGVLARYRVDLWLDGHTHAPSCLGLNELRSRAYGTIFLNVASIRRDAALGRVESRILVLERGSDRLLVLDRYHEEERFAPGRTRNFRLSRAAEWRDKSIRLVPYPRE